MEIEKPIYPKYDAKKKDPIDGYAFMGYLLLLLITALSIWFIFGNNSNEDMINYNSNGVVSSSSTPRSGGVSVYSKCSKLESQLNWNFTSELSSKFVALNCDSVLGASTREARVDEIRDAFKGY